MAYLRGTIYALLVLAALPLSAGEPVLAPQQGLLLLRNGNVIQGQITRAGDYYLVTFGEHGQAKLAARDVETVCLDLDDAYRYKLAIITGATAAPHLDLAQWCLRHDLLVQADEQLAEAIRKEPKNPRIAALQRRLKLAREVPAPKPARHVATATTVSPEQLDKTIGALPAGTMEKFAAVAQPILLNRCATGGCHGQAAKSDFRLLRPAAGQSPSTRFTQRNLYAVLQHLDQARPADSPLLKLPQTRHGGASPLFDKRSQPQLDELTAWVRHALATPSPSPPATISRTLPHLSQQPDAAVQQAAAISEVDPAAPPPTVSRDNDAPMPFVPPTGAAPLPGAAPFVPRDPFDPEIFNRLHRDKAKR